MQTEAYFPLLKDQRLALVTNQTGVIENRHLVDSLLEAGFSIQRVFAPEHGFRGKEDAGAHVDSEVDKRTGLQLVSLYGSNKKPKPSQLADVDLVVFDIQDVGARFYTYLSTLHYVMEACAEQNVKIIVLDRPNPNGNYIDGPVLEQEFASFVGLHPVPIVYGMTIGEYAQMINGESWTNAPACDLTVIPCKGYTHTSKVNLPIPPSPNLKSAEAIALYPSLCLFEPTVVSIGRGTNRPFEMFGHPAFEDMPFSFTPVSSVGASSPKWEFKTCYGYDLHDQGTIQPTQINLSYLLEAFELAGKNSQFFESPSFFNKLAGTDRLKAQIEAGASETEIRKSWSEDLAIFKKVRAKYLIYQ